MIVVLQQLCSSRRRMLYTDIWLPCLAWKTRHTSLLFCASDTLQPSFCKSYSCEGRSPFPSREAFGATVIRFPSHDNPQRPGFYDAGCVDI